MIENAGQLALLGATIVVTTGLLTLGFVAGFRLGRQFSNPHLVASHDEQSLADQLASYQQLCDRIEERSRSVQEMLDRQRAWVPTDLTAQVELLVQTIESLQEVNQEPAAPRPVSKSVGLSQPWSISLPVVCETDNGTLTAEEVHALTSSTGSPVENGEAKRRYPYRGEHLVWPWYADESAPRTKSQSARCNDISIEGISFFWPDAPEFNRLLIGLDEHSKLMVAEVRQSKAVYMHGEVQYLIGCRFLGRHNAVAPGAAGAAL